MSVMDAGQLTRLRTAITSYLPDTAQVLRSVIASDGQGGKAQNFQPHGSPFACLLVQFAGRGGAQEAIVTGGFEEAVRYKLVCPPDTDITARDRVQVTSAGTARTFEVNAVLPESWEVQRQVLLTERLSG